MSDEFQALTEELRGKGGPKQNLFFTVSDIEFYVLSCGAI